MSLILLHPSICIASVHKLIAFILKLLSCEIKNKHFWPYTKYNNICLNYQKLGWPEPSSPM